MKRSVESLEYVRVPVSVKVSGVDFNPTSDAVRLAFTGTLVDPVDEDWVDADWETVTVGTTTTYYARCLVGPGGTFVPEIGYYGVWVKVTDDPELPVLKSGSINFF